MTIAQHINHTGSEFIIDYNPANDFPYLVGLIINERQYNTKRFSDIKSAVDNYEQRIYIETHSYA